MYLNELRAKPHLSASSISDYVECGLLYRFGRIDRLPMEFVSDALEYGSTIHRVLESYYQSKLIGDRMSLKEIHQSFEKYWREAAEGRSDIKYSKGKDFETLLMNGKDLLTSAFMKIQDENFNVLGIEEAFSFNIPGVEVPIIGAVDLISEDEAGTLIITDWKTSGRAYSADEVDSNFQLLIYYMAARANGYADREIILKFDTLIKTKKPRFEQYFTVRSEVDEIRAKRKIQTVWTGIKSEIFIPNDSSWRCKSCHFRTACDEWFLNGGVR
jgi:putative RecB family exonuclease